MSDLVRGKYPVTNDLVKLTGGFNNATQGNLATRTNAEWVGMNGLTDGAALATGVCTSVAVPVEFGDVITKVSVPMGATAATPTHSWAALYSGIATPALLAQSTDGGAAAIAASATFTFTLASPVVVTPVNAPNGYLYVSVMVSGTPNSAASVTNAVAVAYSYFTNSPLFLCATHGAALTTTAPATIASPAKQAVTPLVFLT